MDFSNVNFSPLYSARVPQTELASTKLQMQMVSPAAGSHLSSTSGLLEQLEVSDPEILIKLLREGKMMRVWWRELTSCAGDTGNSFINKGPRFIKEARIIGPEAGEPNSDSELSATTCNAM